jgi:hypothetical protein
MQSAVRFTRLTNFMRASKQSRTFILAILFCATAPFNGCGRKETAPLSEAAENPSASSGAKLAELPLDQQTEQKLDPLTNEDLELYLKVMRAAAERVKHLAPADQAALDGARKILATSASGRVPARDDVKTLERANLVAIAMDQIVAEEMKLDGRTYRGIVEAIESVMPNRASGAPSGDGGAPAPDHAPTMLEKRLNQVNAANEKFLAPYRKEVQQLIAVVRNPANLPK